MSTTAKARESDLREAHSGAETPLSEFRPYLFCRVAFSSCSRPDKPRGTHGVCSRVKECCSPMTGLSRAVAMLASVANGLELAGGVR